MKKLRAIKSIRRVTKAWQSDGKSIALVPTMGALHEGHISLIRKARAKADKVVVSLFVNPTQFSPTEDYSSYPRKEKEDCRICKAEGVDAIFIPKAEDIFLPNHSTWIEEESLSTVLCGARRPGHFRGVCTVVLKLFMLCIPSYAYFGWKDAQQALVISRMVRDLNVDVEIITCDIKRALDGLALSSRNKYLSDEQRAQAPVIYDALQHIDEWKREECSISQLRKKLIRYIQEAPDARIDYVEIVDKNTLQEVTKPQKGQELIIAVAVLFGSARLIDNILITW